jgi:hypothetical protein
MSDEARKTLKPSVFVTADDFFREVVVDAFAQRKVKTFPLAESYLIKLLTHFVSTNHLFDVDSESGLHRQETLAEMFLKATSDERGPRVDLLKKLGDVSLYVSGVFGDSLNNKTVDIDYYADMGGLAYSNLASIVKEDTFRHLYREYSERFLDYVEVLNFVSQKVFIQNNENLLRLYERYVRTGSEIAKETLIERGIIPDDTVRKSFKQ